MTLRRGYSVSPLRLAAFVHLPGQQVAVENCCVQELDELCAPGATDAVLQEVDEAVIALQPEQFYLIPGILRCLNLLCLPARALVDLGEGVVVRERLFQLGRMQMLDLTQTPADFSTMPSSSACSTSPSPPRSCCSPRRCSSSSRF